jgi:tRNA uridine 5-carboxymethylaminomethyl modification enzyme
MRNFDIIVVGGGHAGIEASSAGARMGLQVALVTMDKNAIGRLSCNPAIGGSAKGHLVHEVDALGGVMGELADKTGIQFRTLNKSKGPAVWAHRCQSDRELYSAAASQLMQSTKNLTIVEDFVIEALAENGEVKGVLLGSGNELKCKALIVCSGTFLNGKMFTGLNATSGGRFGEKPAVGLTESLRALGFESGRLKTGTPPRLLKSSINFDILDEQPGDVPPEPFSRRTDKKLFPYQRQVSCFLTHTSIATHKILEKGFGESPMFTGLISGVGPRYCPSIEDKIVRFADKQSHQLFLEPEGLDDELVYVNGFPTSLPADIQYEAIKTVKGLEEAVMVRPGYAVEYDYFPPYQIDLTLETKKIKGLYFAGQVNGTSGYEEAAAQGLIAGINAALKIKGEPEFTLKRSEAYTGVLIDDLVNKSTNEPYRMFTSRAEHRLLLRQDNSDRRLLKKGYEIGLVSREEYEEFKEKEALISASINLFNSIKVSGREINPFLESKGENAIDTPETISKLCKRPNVNLVDVLETSGDPRVKELKGLLEKKEALLEVETELKYEGYIQRQQELAGKMEKYESVNIPLNFNFLNIKALSSEGKEKLNKVKPRSIGQASRISGVTPSDISILLVYLKG